MKKIKRYIASCLVLVITISAVLPGTSRTVYASELSDMQYSIVTRCKDLISYLSQNHSGDYGLLYDLRQIMELGMYVGHMENCDELEFKDSEIQYYKEQYENVVTQFNNRYGSESNQYTKLSLTTDKPSFRENFEINMRKEIPDYLTSRLKKINDLYNELESEDKRQSYLTDNKVLIMNLYKIVNVYQTVPTDLTNLTPLNSSGKKEAYSVISNDNNNKIIKDIINKIITDYEMLLSYGKKVTQEQNITSQIPIDLSKDYAEILTDATVNENGDILSKESFKLSTAYLAILASSSVYTPLESYVGDSEFTSSLQSLATSDIEGKNLVTVFNDTKNLRKPLYRRSLDSEGNPTGTAKLITIKEFFDAIESGDSGALVSVTGEFAYNSEVDSWVYYQDKSDVSLDSTNSETDDVNSETDQEQSTDSNDRESSEDLFTDINKDDYKGEPEKYYTKVVSRIQSIIEQYRKTDDTDTEVRNNLKAAYKTAILQLADCSAGVGSDKVDNTSELYKIKNDGDSTFNNIIDSVIDLATPSWGTSFQKSTAKVIDHFRTIYALAKVCEEAKAPDTVKTKLKNSANQDLMLLAKKYGVSQPKNLNDNTNPFYVNGKKWASYKDWVNNATGGRVTVSSEDLSQNDIKDKEVKSFKNSLNKEKIKFSSIKVVKSPKHNNYYLVAISKNSDKKSKNTTNSIFANIRKLEKLGNVSAATTATDITTTTTSATDSSTESETTTATEKTTITDSFDNSVQSDSSYSDSVSNNGNNSVSSSEPSLDNAIYAYEENTDESKLTQPLLFYGTRYSRAVDNATTMILNNIIKNAKNLSSIKNKSTRYLYVNIYGDIVTDDNLVILPGIANPLLYKEESDYNPYSVAFVNNYPNVLVKSTSLKFTSNNDIGKYLLMAATKDKDVKDAEIKGYLIDSNETVKSTNTISFPNIFTKFYANTTDSIDIYSANRYVIGDVIEWKNGPLYEWSLVVIMKTPTANNNIIFPYVPSEDLSYEVAQVIAANMFTYLALDQATNSYSTANRLADNYIAHNFIFNGLNGTNNPLGYAKNQLLEYEQYVNNSLERFSSQIKDLSTNLLSKIKDVDGVLGLKSSYVDPILGSVFQYVRDLFIPFMFICALLFLVAFLKMKRDLFETSLLTVFSLGILYLFIYLFPIYLPMVYNMGLNNICENLSYKILGINTEINDTIDTNIAQINSEGDFKFDTTSLTLYRVGFNEIGQLAADLGVEENELSGGKRVIIDQESGLFAEGDSIKINTDILFKTLPIEGSFDDDDSDGVYTVKATKTVSNNLDYYTPYYQLVDIFINRLNTLANIYQIPRKTTVYANNKNKDNYLVYSFVNSDVFLMPGDYTDTNLYETTMSDEELQEYYNQNKVIAMQLEENFGKTDDFLGLTELLYNLTEEEKGTLWANTMRENGYYNDNWEPDVERINKVISYVNLHTKKFIFDLEDQVGKLSDSTMIKLICLRALVALTQETSEYGHWWYPFSINYEEMSLGDIVQCIYTNDYSKYINLDMDVVNYIGNELGWFHLIIFDIVIVLMFIIVNVIKILVPVLYLLLGFAIIFKLFTRDDIKLPLKGFLKSNILVMTVFTLFGVSLVISSNMNGSTFSLYITLFVCLIVLYILFMVFTSLIYNITDLGNSQINVRISKLLDKLPFGNSIRNIHVNNLVHNNSSKTKSERKSYRERFSKYSQDASVEDRYSNDNNYYNDNTSNNRHSSRNDIDDYVGTSNDEPIDDLYQNIDNDDLTDLRQ